MSRSDDRSADCRKSELAEQPAKSGRIYYTEKVGTQLRTISIYPPGPLRTGYFFAWPDVPTALMSAVTKLLKSGK